MTMTGGREVVRLVWRGVETPLGPMVAGAAVSRGREALCLLEFGDGARARAGRGEVSGIFGASWREGSCEAIDRTAAWLEAYFAGEARAFAGAIETPGTDFQRRVWSALLEIGHGETVTYAGLAVRLGVPGAARAVGAANGRNRIAIVVPCHRVVAAEGLGGYGGGLARKRRLLELEGGQFVEAPLFACAGGGEEMRGC